MLCPVHQGIFVVIINGQKVTGSSNVATSDYSPQNSPESPLKKMNLKEKQNGA